MPGTGSRKDAKAQRGCETGVIRQSPSQVRHPHSTRPVIKAALTWRSRSPGPAHVPLRVFAPLREPLKSRDTDRADWVHRADRPRAAYEDPTRPARRTRAIRPDLPDPHNPRRWPLTVLSRVSNRRAPSDSRKASRTRALASACLMRLLPDRLERGLDINGAIERGEAEVAEPLGAEARLALAGEPFVPWKGLRIRRVDLGHGVVAVRRPSVRRAGLPSAGAGIGRSRCPSSTARRHAQLRAPPGVRRS